MPTKLLVVEKDFSISDILNPLLIGRGYEICSIQSDRDILKEVYESEPRLVILDWSIHNPDVLNLCQQLRINCKVPILAISTIDEQSTVTNALDAGADDILIRPVSSNVLLASIKNLTRRVEMNGKGPRIKTAPLQQEGKILGLKHPQTE